MLRMLYPKGAATQMNAFLLKNYMEMELSEMPVPSYGADEVLVSV